MIICPCSLSTQVNGNRDHVAFCQVRLTGAILQTVVPRAISYFYLLSTLYVAHLILDTRPSRFSGEYVEKSWVGPGDEARLKLHLIWKNLIHACMFVCTCSFMPKCYMMWARSRAHVRDDLYPICTKLQSGCIVWLCIESSCIISKKSCRHQSYKSGWCVLWRRCRIFFCLVCGSLEKKSYATTLGV